jgi:hypothetical protein
MNNTYLTTELIIALIEMQKDPIPAMGLLDIEIKLGQQNALRYFFTKKVKVEDGSTITEDGSCPIVVVNERFDRERNRRVREAVKNKIIEIETEKNGFHKISGACVRVFNIKKVHNAWSATIVLYDSPESKGERYDNCEYPTNIINLGSIK